MTQDELAASLGVKQPTLSRLEGQDDMQISTLRRVIEALGGELEIIQTENDHVLGFMRTHADQRAVSPAIRTEPVSSPISGTRAFFCGWVLRSGK